MECIFLWGSDKFADDMLTGIESNIPDVLYKDICIAGIIDNEPSKWGSYFHGLKIVSPGYAIDHGFDYIVITMKGKDVWLIEKQATYGYRIPKEKVKKYHQLLKSIFCYKYSGSNDPEVVAVLNYLSNHDISMFNQYLPEQPYQEVHWDMKLNLPYIDFFDVCGKRHNMYYPRDYKFEVKNEVEVVRDVSWEQLPNSPHVYTFPGHDIKDGDVILDGGVCEGNFSLKYASIVSKMYLFESDRSWDEPHYYTFKEYNDKVCYIPKRLTNIVTKSSDTIDNVINNGRLDFIKLDIEGFEKRALDGALNVLNSNNILCSVCAYHRSGDGMELKNFFENISYKTSYSYGIVSFLWGNDIWEKLDFRKCVIYANK